MTIQTLCHRYTNAIPTLCKHYANTMQTLCKHYANTMQTLYQHYATFGQQQNVNAINAIFYFALCIHCDLSVKSLRLCVKKNQKKMPSVLFFTLLLTP